MKLIQFIQELEYVAKNIDRPDRVEVEMADCIPVVRPVYKNNTVYITDVLQRRSKDTIKVK